MNWLGGLFSVQMQRVENCILFWGGKTEETSNRRIWFYCSWMETNETIIKWVERKCYDQTICLVVKWDASCCFFEEFIMRICANILAKCTLIGWLVCHDHWTKIVIFLWAFVHLTNDKLECAFMGKVVAATNKMAIQQSNHTHKFIPRMDQKGQNER